MTTLTAPVAATSSTGGDDLNHIYCCDPDVSLCGTNLSGHSEVDFDEADCVVCHDLDGMEGPCGPGCPVGVTP